MSTTSIRHLVRPVACPPVATSQPRPALLPTEQMANPSLPADVARAYVALGRIDPLSERPSILGWLWLLCSLGVIASVAVLPDAWTATGIVISTLGLFATPTVALAVYANRKSRAIEARYDFTVTVPVAAKRAWDRFDIAAARVRYSHAPVDMLSDIAAIAPVMDDLLWLARDLRKQDYAGHERLLEVVAEMNRIADEAETFAEAAATYPDREVEHRLDTARTVALTAPADLSDATPIVRP